MTRPERVWLSSALIVASFVPQWFDPVLDLPITGPVEKMFLFATCLVFGFAVALVLFRGSRIGRDGLAVLVGLSLIVTFFSGDALDAQTLLIAFARVLAAALLFTPRVSEWMAAEQTKARAPAGRLAPGSRRPIPNLAFRRESVANRA